MRLSDHEERILPLVELSADMSSKEIAARLNMRETSVRYSLHKLEREGVIQRVGFIDMCQMGYTDYTFFFSISPTKKHSRAALLQSICNHPSVTLVAELGGTYQYVASSFAQSAQEFLSLMQELSLEATFVQKSFSIRTAVTRFNRIYLAHDQQRMALSFGTPGKYVIDLHDDRILSELAVQGQRSLREISLSLHMPIPSFHLRVKKLTQKGILRGSAYVVDSGKIGQLTYELLIVSRGIQPALRDSLFAWCYENKHAIHFLECIGEWDYEIGIEVAHAEQISSYVEDLYSHYGSYISHIQVIPLFKYHKYSLYRSVVL